MVAIMLLCVVGVGINVESTEVYLNLKIAPDDYVSSCNISEKVNCEEVEKSEWAVVAGVPVALWAVCGYILMGVLALIGFVSRERRRERGFLVLLTGVSLVASVGLIYLMAFEIGAWCTLCLATDAVNVGLFIMVVLSARVDGLALKEAVVQDFAWLFGTPAVLAAHVLIGGALLAGTYMVTERYIDAPIREAELEEKAELAQAFALGGADAHEKKHNPGVGPESKWVGDSVPAKGCEHAGQCQCEEETAEKPEKRPVTVMGTDEHGHHWVGAEEPTLVIHEYTDYECPHCRRAHMRVRRLLSKYPGQIRVVHRHYPLDHRCNPLLKDRKFHLRACELSQVAVCAGEQGRFWEMNDLLFQHAKDIKEKKPSAEDLARRLELDVDKFQCCMTSSESSAAISRDVNEGMAHGLKGTPAFVIDGKAYLGKIPNEVLARLQER